MLTEAQAEMDRKRTRRTMFWRLYSLPWILLCLFLVLCVLAAITYKHESPPEYLQAIENSKNLTREMEAMRAEAVRTGNGHWIVLPNGANSFVYTAQTNVVNNYDLRKDIMEVLAIQRDLFEQMYIQVSNGNRAAKLMTGAAEAVRKESSILSGVAKEMESKLSNFSNAPSIQPKSIGIVENARTFDGGDWLLAESVGYDLEKELDKGIRGLISFEFARWDGKSKKELEDRLQTGSQKIIDGAFEGFKTYHRVGEGRSKQ